MTNLRWYHSEIGKKNWDNYDIAIGPDIANICWGIVKGEETCWKKIRVEVISDQT